MSGLTVRGVSVTLGGEPRTTAGELREVARPWIHTQLIEGGGAERLERNFLRLLPIQGSV